MPPHARVVVCIGRLSFEKGHADLVDAMAILRAHAPSLPVRLVVAGDGPERDRLAARAAQAGIGDIVSWLGFVPRAQQTLCRRRCRGAAVTLRRLAERAARSGSVSAADRRDRRGRRRRYLRARPERSAGAAAAARGAGSRAWRVANQSVALGQARPGGAARCGDAPPSGRADAGTHCPLLGNHTSAGRTVERRSIRMRVLMVLHAPPCSPALGPARRHLHLFEEISRGTAYRS